MGKKITTANQLSVARKVGNEKGKDGLMWDRILRWESNKLSHWESKFSRLDYFSFRSMDDLFFFRFFFFLIFPCLSFLFLHNNCDDVNCKNTTRSRGSKDGDQHMFLERECLVERVAAMRFSKGWFCRQRIGLHIMPTPESMSGMLVLAE